METSETAGEAGAPCTVAGHWLLAVLLGQRESEKRLLRMLNGGENGWNKSEAAVVEIAAEFAARRYFRSNINPHEIAIFASELRERAHSTAPPDQSETEAAIYAFLGQPSAAMPHVSAGELFFIHVAVLGWAVVKLNLNQSEIRRLVERSERQAVKRGWNPPLYPVFSDPAPDS